LSLEESKGEVENHTVNNQEGQENDGEELVLNSNSDDATQVNSRSPDRGDLDEIMDVLNNTTQVENDKANEEACLSGDEFGTNTNHLEDQNLDNSQSQQEVVEFEEPAGPYICKFCHEEYKSWGTLTRHFITPHLFKCDFCDLIFNRRSNLEDHTNMLHDLVGLIDSTHCGMCGETFSRSSTLARHIAAPHNFPCRKCEKKFQSKPALTKHNQVCPNKHLVIEEEEPEKKTKKGKKRKAKKGSPRKVQEVVPRQKELERLRLMNLLRMSVQRQKWIAMKTPFLSLWTGKTLSQLVLHHLKRLKMMSHLKMR